MVQLILESQKYIIKNAIDIEVFANIFTDTGTVYVINLNDEEAELMYMSIFALTKNLESVWYD